MKCKICETEGYEINVSKYPKDFCSYKCYETWLKTNKEPNCKCTVCGKQMYIKESRLKRAKNGITCSKECANKLKSKYFSGQGNHQWGLIGALNASSKGWTKYNTTGYILEYCPGHPYPNDTSNKMPRVLQHRLVIEQNYYKFDLQFFEYLNDRYVLKPEYEVHHINEIKDDNRIENLQIVTRSEHSRIHTNLLQSRNKKILEIIGVLKRGELLENLEVDDQQPSQNSNILEGSTTNNRIRIKSDSNIDTSALLEQIINIVSDDIVWSTHITNESVEVKDKEL